MRPVLFEIGPLVLRTHGVSIVIGFLLGTYVVARLVQWTELDFRRMIDLACWSFLIGLVGARLLHVFVRASYYSQDPLAILRFWEGGLVFFGGPLAVLPFAIWYSRKHRLPKWQTLDALVPGLVIGLMIGRFGCLAAGCCYGRPTASGFGVRLHSELVPREFRGIPLHPTQLYEAGALGVLFLGCLWVTRHRTFPGQVFLSCSMAYAVTRSVIEIFRGDRVRGYVVEGIFSTSQFLALLVFTSAVIAYVYRSRREKSQVR